VLLLVAQGGERDQGPLLIAISQTCELCQDVTEEFAELVSCHWLVCLFHVPVSGRRSAPSAGLTGRTRTAASPRGRCWPARPMTSPSRPARFT
jgi:hypothetical protein